MLILLFAVRLGWLPASGYVAPWEDLGRNLTTILLPSFVLGTGVAGVMMRHTRGAMLETMGADYVRTARAKSVPERLVVLKHALRNALIPVITLGAIEFGRLLSGAVLTEQIFAIPGFGKMLVDGVFNRDYAVVQGVVLVSAGALRAAEPHGRHAVLPGQPAAARLMSDAVAVAAPIAGAREPGARHVVRRLLPAAAAP